MSIISNNFIGAKKSLLDTPCLVLNYPKFERNAKAMQQWAAKNKKQLRPHAKTHKCTEIAKRLLEWGNGVVVGTCVAKVSEAEVFVKAGMRGTLVTSPVVTPFKISRLMECLRKDPELMVVVDNKDNARALNEAAQAHGLSLGVLVDVDGGQTRTGVTSTAAALELGSLISNSLPNLKLRGVQCYCGSVQHIKSFAERRQKSLEGMAKGVDVVRAFKERGLPCDIFTGSGTGTFDIDVEIPELTEMQPGSYVMMDAEYLLIGSKEDPARFSPTFADPPLTLMSTVISANHLPDQGKVTIDAGLKAIYSDGNVPLVVKPSGGGYTYTWAGDEHGYVHIPPSATTDGNIEKLSVGSVVELVVSHVDPTVNLFDEIFVTDENDVVTAVWKIDARGKSQ
eukprot:GEZU01032709.1.p1 GENE.GEZU01032709.1~~GEZU01032709.1.p1  ORF type:complete len:395 (+),score=90.99 GEZU01032709.1:265-1449(+)